MGMRLGIMGCDIQEADRSPIIKDFQVLLNKFGFETFRQETLERRGML
jgi:hypothetical protein